MSKKLVIRTCFWVFFFFFLFGGIEAKVQPIYIYIDLDFRMAPDLQFPLERLKEDVIAGMEKGFSDKGILLVKREYQSDYKLEGTVEVKHFIKSSASYSILFKVKHFKISATSYRGLIPPLTFHPFTSRDKTDGVSPAQDIDDAIDLALGDLLYMMDLNKVFDFQSHPIFAKVVKVEKKDIDQIKKREDFDCIADRIIKELKDAIDAALKARLSQLPQPTVTIKDNSKELKKIMEEIIELKKQKGSIYWLKKMLKKQMGHIDEIRYVNYASIIIETNAVNIELGSTFKAVIMPNKPCPECVETQIKAVNLGRIATKETLTNSPRSSSTVLLIE